jgi:hypothetical protein
VSARVGREQAKPGREFEQNKLETTPSLEAVGPPEIATDICGYRYVVVSAEPAAIANASPPTVSRVSMRQDESAWNLHGHRPRVKQFPNDGEMMVVVLRNKDR